MPEYRRSHVRGGTYFFTVNLLDRRSDLLVREIDALRTAVRAVKTRRPFHIDAWVVLPEHMHCIWTLPENDADYSGRWRAIKVAFVKSLAATEARTPTMTRRGERGVWQKRFWEHTIRDERDLRAHMDYVHLNPVKHGLVEHPAAWPHSSFLRCVAQGFYDAAWRGADAVLSAGKYVEVAEGASLFRPTQF